MPATHTRRTSIYNLRVEDVSHADAGTVMQEVATQVARSRYLTDQHTHMEADGYGYVSVGFRATDDEDARAVAESVRPYLPGDSTGPRYPRLTLNTGFGIHRREFTADPEHVAEDVDYYDTLRDQTPTDLGYEDPRA